MKLHEILIGFILVAAMVTGFVMFYSGGSEEYAVSSYNEEQFANITNGMEEIINISRDTNSALENISTSSGLTDILGGFVVSAYGAVRTAGASLGVFISAVDIVVKPLNLYEFGGVLKSALGGILLIAFIAIFVHIITKSDRT